MKFMGVEIEDFTDGVECEEDLNIIPFTREVFRLEDYLDENPYEMTDGRPDPERGDY